MNEKKQRVYFVSLGGCDKNPGTEEKPFKTLEKARDEIRALDKNIHREIIVYIREGVYAIGSTLELDERDSAEEGSYVMYAAYPGEKVVISGGKELKGWEKVEDRENGSLWRIKAEDISNTRHLYINGVPASRARSSAFESHAWEKVENSEFEFCNLLETFTTYQGELKVYEGYKSRNKEMLLWRNHKDIEFVYDVGWTHCICPVDEISESGEYVYIKMRMPCFRDCQIKPGVQIGAPSYIENAFELLNEPGHWYFDREEGFIYYIPREGEDMSCAETTVPYVERLLQLKGTLDKPVKNICFKGIEFTYSTWLKPSQEGHAEIQANLVKDPKEDRLFHSTFIKPPSAVVLDAAEHIRIEDCVFSRLGCGGIDIQHGARNNSISGCDFFEISGTGIQLGDFSFNDAHPKAELEIVKNNSIRNNIFHSIGTEYKGSVGVLVGYTEGTVIEHNELFNIAYSGISVGWGWGYCDPDANDRMFYKPPEYYPRYEKPGICSKNIIAYNHIHHVMQKLHDGAGIYTLGLQPDSKITGNHIHDNGGFKGKGFDGEVFRHDSWKQTDFDRQFTMKKGFPGGIYMDEASGGFEVTGNIIYNVVVPIHYHNVGMNNRFETNRFYGNYNNILPKDKAFPEEKAQKAGLQKDYRHLLVKWEKELNAYNI